MQYWTQLLIAIHLTVDVWTLFYCLLCILCFDVCCNPAFLATKSNDSYIIIKTDARFFKVLVFPLSLFVFACAGLNWLYSQFLITQILIWFHLIEDIAIYDIVKKMHFRLHFSLSYQSLLSAPCGFRSLGFVRIDHRPICFWPDVVRGN